MKSISRLEAIQELRDEVASRLSTDDVVEVFRELNPSDQADRTTLESDPQRLRAIVLNQLTDDLDGVTVEEIWSVVFPQHRRVEFDADQDQLHYKPRTTAAV